MEPTYPAETPLTAPSSDENLPAAETPAAGLLLPLVAAVAKKPEPAYPTMAESWVVLVWYLLLMLVVGIEWAVLQLAVPKQYQEVALYLLSDVGLVGLIWLLLHYVGTRAVPTRWVGPADGWRLWLLLPPLTLAIILSLTPISWLGLPDWGVLKTIEELMAHPVLALLVLCVGAPVLEEWLFRGILLPGLERNYGATKAILQSSLLFGLIHFNPAQSVNAFLLGCFQGWLYTRTRSLRACILVHAVNNLLSWAWFMYYHRATDWTESWASVGAGELGLIGLAVLATGAGIGYLHRLTAFKG